MTDRDSPSDANQHTMLVQKLFLQHSGGLRDYLLSLLPDANTVDDLLHGVFLTAMQRADQFQSGTNFLAWLRAIGKFKLLELARDNRRSPRTFSPDVIDTLTAAAPDFDEQGERLTAMAECTDELAPRSRQAIQLRYVDALRPAEIAERMKLAVESVHVMLTRARVALRECIEKKLPHWKEG
ncbi:MAG: sigma-70 family RNA polymerase sigma factor [Planctomycetia bacterium]|nr:sigma-70 family RNA polymerase sigma factor [Planctomycetia bacterium]